MSRFFSKDMEALLPYVPGEQPRETITLKLNTNEHSHGPSPKAIAAIRAATGDDLRLYPDPTARGLCEAIADSQGVHADQVFVGNGSDEVLAHIFRGLFQREGALLLADITYSFYRTYAALFGVQARLIALADDFTIRVEDYLGPHDAPVAGIIIANPNAPTGIALEPAQIARILAANPDVPVVIDEAYVDFSRHHCASLLARHDNLVIVHTLSKSRALAGLRVGYALASADIVAGLNRVKNSFNSYPLDRLAQAGAIAAMRDQAWFDRACADVIREREALARRLQSMGFQVLPSQTNFLFVRHPDHDAADLAAALRRHGILVRHFSQERIAQFLRITVGLPEQCAMLCDALAGILPSRR